MATESGRSTRRQVMRRQLTVARKNGSAYRPLDGSSRDGSTVSAPESIASSCPAGSTGSAGSSTMSGLLPAREREVEDVAHDAGERSEEHTSELQSLMRISYAVFGLKKKKTNIKSESTREIVGKRNT